MNEEDLCLKVQKNWIRIKHETQTIRDRLMDKCLAEGAVSVDQIKDIKCRHREEQFDFFLYTVIEARRCKMLLKVLETYGRRQLCVAIRKTELDDRDYNTSTRSTLEEVTRRNFGTRLKLHVQATEVIRKEDNEETSRYQTEQVDEAEYLTDVKDTKCEPAVVKKKVSKKKVKPAVVALKENMKSVRHENEKLKTITRVKTDEVFKLRAQLDAKREEVKWLKAQVDDKDSKYRNNAELLQKSNDEKLNLKKRLRDSKREQIELTTKLMDNDSKIKGLKSMFSESTNPDRQGKETGKIIDESTDRLRKMVRFENEDCGVNAYKSMDTLHDIHHALENAMEERDCVDRLLKIENAEILKLTTEIRNKSDENERLQKELKHMGHPVQKINNRIRTNDFEIRDAKDTLGKHMKAVAELTERLRPISLKVDVIKNKLYELECLNYTF